MASGSGSRATGVLVAVGWVVAVVVAGSLAVLGLRIASGGSAPADTVLSASEAQALATTTPSSSSSPSTSASPTPSPTASTPVTTPPADAVRLAIPGAVLGVRCDAGTPVLAWSVPDPGWTVRDAEPEDGGLRVRLESADSETRVEIACSGGVPAVVRTDPGSGGGDDD